MKRTIVFLAATPFLLGACGWSMSQGPPAGHEKMMTVSCSENPIGPAFDILAILATIASVSLANGLDDSGDHAQNAASRTLVGTAIVGVFALSAGIGIDRMNKCSAAKRALGLRQAEAAAVLAARRRSADLIAVQKVSVTGGRDTMRVGTLTQLVATAYDSTSAVIVDKMFAWWSSNDRIASVSAGGVVQARHAGTAVITASAGNVIGTVNVVVRGD